MKDAFLEAHRRAKRFYDIGCKLSPISIRDQMVRGCMLVERAIRQGLLVAGGPGLIVVGAGAGGATAAVHAARRGVKVILVERKKSPFLVQARTSSRWVDPNQYDWPLDHWTNDRFPWRQPAMVPIRWDADFASSLAVGFTRQLNAQQARSTPDTGLQWIRYETTVKRVVWSDAEPGALEVTLDSAVAGTTVHQAGMIVYATGPGEERSYLDQIVGNPVTRVYSGLGFWNTDKINRLYYGLENIVPQVIIGGSGDGSIQDFLRVVTKRRSANEIYQACRVPEAIGRRIHSIEDRAKRWWMWADHDDGVILRDRDHELNQSLEEEYEEVIEQALTPRNGEVWSALRLLIDRPPDVKVVFRCHHLTCYYALNRFLGGLIARFIKLEYGQEVFMKCSSVVNVSHLHGLPHDKDACYGQLHTVYIAPWPHCGDAVPVGPPDPYPANILLIRHGLDKGSDPITNTPPVQTLGRRRHLLPYYSWI